ncbi:hypothetical protein H6G18_06125 [Anabaena subtropica FACHB-260]|uniref:Uncharacterized protein n=2 Tax=Anabaena TaxID=1163 RepID=A0ABR8CNI5_9NOST|nr:hypothetical protein [Anabaena subtropica FACHB-260]
MNNPNERETYNREVSQKSYTDSNGNTQTHVTRTTETPNNSYRNGYVNGRNLERNYQADRANENTATGLIFGIVLTSLVGLTAGALWYFNQNNNAVDSTAPVETPLPVNASPNLSPQPQQTTIIERTREVPVVIPQQEVPPATNSQPQVNVTVPPQPSVRETAPVITDTPQPTQTTAPTTDTQASPSPTITPQTGDQSQGDSGSSSADDVNQNNNSGQ